MSLAAKSKVGKFCTLNSVTKLRGCVCDTCHASKAMQLSFLPKPACRLHSINWALVHDEVWIIISTALLLDLCAGLGPGLDRMGFLK